LLALFNKAVHDKVVEIVPERRDSARSCGDNFDHGFVACRNQILQAVEEG
jgi:hypothetical protein